MTGQAHHWHLSAHFQLSTSPLYERGAERQTLRVSLMLRVIRHNSAHISSPQAFTYIYPWSPSLLRPFPSDLVILLEVGAALRAFLEATKASFKPRDDHDPFSGMPSHWHAVYT
jgi:hypothetical protein